MRLEVESATSFFTDSQDFVATHVSVQGLGGERVKTISSDA